MAETAREAIGTVRRNIRDRIRSLKNVFRVQVELTRKLIDDVRGRFGAEAREPSLPKEAGLPGVVASIPESIIAYAILTSDNIARFVQEQAAITRRWVRRE